MPPSARTTSSKERAAAASASKSKSKNIRSKEQLKIAGFIKTALESCANCLDEVSNLYRDFAFDFVEIDAEIDSRKAALAHFDVEPAPGESEWIPSSFRFSKVCHGLNKDQQLKPAYKDIIDRSNSILETAKKDLKAEAKLVVAQRLLDSQTKKYDMFIEAAIFLSKSILRSGMLDDAVDKELAGKTLTHQAGWHLLHHLRKVKDRTDHPLVQDLSPMTDIETFLHPFSYEKLMGSIFRKTIPGALTPDGVHEIVNAEGFLAERATETGKFFDQNMFIASNTPPLPDVNYPLIWIFSHGVRNEIKKLILEKKRNATIKALKESKTQVTAVDLTEKALSELLADHDVNDGPLTDVIASHVGQAEKDWARKHASLEVKIALLEKALKKKTSSSLPPVKGAGAPKTPGGQPKGNLKRKAGHDATSTVRFADLPPQEKKKHIEAAREKNAKTQRTAAAKKKKKGAKSSAPKRAAQPSRDGQPPRKRFRAQRGAPRN